MLISHIAVLFLIQKPDRYLETGPQNLFLKDQLCPWKGEKISDRIFGIPVLFAIIYASPWSVSPQSTILKVRKEQSLTKIAPGIHKVPSKCRWLDYIE